MDNLSTPSLLSSQQEITQIYQRIDQKIAQASVPVVLEKSFLRRILRLPSKKIDKTHVIGCVMESRVDIHKKDDVNLAKMAESAIDLVTLPSSNITAANHVIGAIKYHIRGVPPIEHRYKLIGYSVGTLFFAFLIMYATIINTSFGINFDISKNFLLVGFCGLIGSLIGFFRRIEDPSQLSLAIPNDILLYFFKPLIGCIFGILSYAVIKSGIVPIRPTDDVAPYLYGIIAVAAGFGEQATSALIDRIQKVMPNETRLK